MNELLTGAQGGLNWTLGTLPESTHLPMDISTKYLYYIRLIGSTDTVGQEEYRDIPVYSNVRLSYRAAVDAAMDIYERYSDQNKSLKFSDAVKDISGSLLLHGRKRE